jgi:lysozyme
MAGITTLRDQLVRDEGRRERLYVDCCGKDRKQCRCSKQGHLTGGVGRNFDAVALCQDEIELMLDNDIRAAKHLVGRWLPWSATIDEVRREVLQNMTFNMGIGWVMEFKKMIEAMQRADWQTAAQELLDSDYGRAATRERALRLATQLETGIRR